MLGVTVNVGCGGPHPRSRAAAMTSWAAGALHREPGLVFAQEVPTAPEWMGTWAEAGYTAVWGGPPVWRPRSVLLARLDVVLEPLSRKEFPALSYHGSYVAAARWVTSPTPRPIIVASVQAAPEPAEPEHYGWPFALPQPRDGGPASRHPRNQLWDSDLLLASLAAFAGQGVIAAGDYNESLTGDAPDASWSEEYRLRAAGAGLVDALLESWGAERPTRFPPDGSKPVQLDHVLVDSVTAPLVASRAAAVDEGWLARTGDVTDGRSDHAPVWFEIDTGSGL
jgi:hypothetical protein